MTKKQPRSAFSMRLLAMRKTLGMTQQEVAKCLSLSRSTYAYYETDTSKPDYETLTRIARIFRVSTDFLLGNQETENKNLSLQDRAFREAMQIRDNTSFAALSKEEKTFLGLYRQLDDKSKEELLMFTLERAEHQFDDPDTTI